MSDNLPVDIQVEIIKRLHVKSLIQFRSVSKAWKSLIDSSPFITCYSGQNSQLEHLFVSYAPTLDKKYVSIIDNDTFPQQKVTLTIPLPVNMFTCSMIIGSSRGLFCLFGSCRNGSWCPVSGKDMAVLWNPSIRKAVAVVMPNIPYGMYETVLGFGVCRETIDPKIVKITTAKWTDMGHISCIPWEVEVFTLSTGAWRSPYSNDLPRKLIQFSSCSVVIDGIIYWLATDKRGEFSYYNLTIISFDTTSEEFREVNLPDSLAQRSIDKLSISKLRESLVLLEHGIEARNTVFHVWMMEDGVAKSFTKLFTVNSKKVDASLVNVRGFRKTGEPIIEIIEDYRRGALVVYEPYSQHISNLGVNGSIGSFSVHPYMETLLLLDKPDVTVYNGTEILKYVIRWFDFFTPIGYAFQSSHV